MTITKKLKRLCCDAGADGYLFNNKDTNDMLKTIYLSIIAESLARIADKLEDISLLVENPSSEIDCCNDFEAKEEGTK